MQELSYVSRRHGPYLDIEFNRTPSERVRIRLRSLGYSFRNGIHSWRGTRNFDEAIAEADRAVAKARYMSEQRVAKPCYTCEHCGKGDFSPCPWEREFKPVPGWDAVRYDKKDVSYKVIWCPMYRKEKKERRRLE
jgi:hypothetical protein